MRVILGPWQPLGEVGLDPDGRLRLPRPAVGPGLYRFLLHDASRTAYVGETDELTRRFGHYRNPGPSQRTNVRLNDRMRAVLASGGSIAVEVCTRADVEVGSCREPLDLRVKSHRLLAEETALAEVRRLGLDAVENVGG